MRLAGLYSLTLSDGARRLVWALPRAAFVPRSDGPTWDLDAEVTDPPRMRFRWRDVVDSLTRWCAAYQVPIALEHGAVGTPVGELAEVASYGVVTGAVEVLAADAAERGVPEQTVDALYLTIEPTPALVDLIDAGQLPYTSPGLRAAYVDETGEAWPLILRELSFTRDPRQKRRQIPTTRAAQVGAALLSEVAMPETEIEITAEGAPTLETLAKALADLTQRVADIEAKVTSEVAEVTDAAEAVAEVADMSESASLRAELAKAQRTIATMRAESQADAMLADRDLAPGARPAIVALLAEGREAQVKALLAAAPKRGTTLHRAPLAAAAPTVNLSDPASVAQAARDLAAREKIPFHDAFNRISIARG